MLGKLLKKDLQKNMRWMWIIFVSAIAVALLTRCFKEIGENVAFFKILGIFFDSVFYSIAINTILQPFLRSFFNFTKSFYGDESYLTHTLPVTKKQLVISKFVTAFIELLLGFASLLISLLIMFYSPTMFQTLKLMLTTIITGEFSLFVVLLLFVLLVFVEFFMFIVLIYYSIVVSYRSKEKRVLKTFLTMALLAFASLTLLSIAMIAVLAINGVEITSSLTILPASAFISVVVTGIIVYVGVALLFYFLTQKEFAKGVDVD